MTQEVIAEPGQMSPSRLTSLLRRRGVLQNGSVTNIAYRSTDTAVSRIVYLDVTYSHDVLQALSASYCLKMSAVHTPTELGQVGRREVQFYSAVMAHGYRLPVPVCYEAVYSDEEQRFHILMDDVSQTHAVATEWPLPPSIGQCEMVVDALVKLHATWWEHTNFGEDIGLAWTEDKIEEKVAWEGKLLHDFVHFLGDRLSPERREIYERVKPFYPRMVERVRSGKNVTLIHGDAHLWNYLYPREGVQGQQVFLIDWDGCAIDIGMSDLACMMALHWFPERRARLEQRLLCRYHEGLLAEGIKGYSWDDCMYDYRLAAIGNLFIPAFQWSAGLSNSLWWDHLERGMLAFEDLGCAAIL